MVGKNYAFKFQFNEKAGSPEVYRGEQEERSGRTVDEVERGNQQFEEVNGNINIINLLP